MQKQNFTYIFTTLESPSEVFKHLINPQNWWVGLHEELINGNSEKPDDEFSFSAGNGAHYSVQKLIEIIPDEKIVWEVTDSNLIFLKIKNEWTGTNISFEISSTDGRTKVIFTHHGLTPQFECFDGCSVAWTQYLENLEKDFK